LPTGDSLGKPASPLDLGEEAAFLHVGAHDAAEVGGGADDADVLHAEFAADHRGVPHGLRHRELERSLGMLGDPVVHRLRVVGRNLAAVSKIPPVVHVAPRPLGHVKHIVAEAREALLDARVDAEDRGAHERDGDDADDDAQRGKQRTQLVGENLQERDANRLWELA
jgi:hypothetical protein